MCGLSQPSRWPAKPAAVVQTRIDSRGSVYTGARCFLSRLLQIFVDFYRYVQIQTVIEPKEGKILDEAVSLKQNKPEL